VAKLPDHKQPRKLADLQALVAGLEGSDSQFEYGEIWRDEDGTYHADPAWRSLQDLSV
jgi:hypothetical protein